MQSLSARLLLTLGIVLLVFFGVTVFVLDLSFRGAAEEAVRERLDVHTIALLSAAEPENGARLEFPAPMPESHFENPGSGLFGSITRPGGEPIWRSPSLVGNAIAFPDYLATGERLFSRTQAADGSDVFTLSLGIEWQLEGRENLPLVVNVAESMNAFNAQVEGFRRQLLGWFAGLAFLLLAAVAAILGWVLAPLRRAENEVRGIEHGVRDVLSEDYPRELKGLTRHTNILLDMERTRSARYKDTLGNLAHSIKTPLSVIRNALADDSDAGQKANLINTQVSRVQTIVDYQLKRAAVSQGSLSVRAIDVQACVEELIDTLDKVHASNSLKVHPNIEEGLQFLGDRGDFLEIVGNLLDNAYKWSKSQVLVSAKSSDLKIGHGKAMQLVVEDDGPGIADEQRDLVLSRGGRADEHIDGHGIGLAVVKETVELLSGSLEIGRSSLGGARISVALPAR
ncbi:MAG: two-component sensor histidine kinase [Gammaproteobacteria bacterium]|nr:two-component sensor histidine kinase [Gammaproteobacteria bacterium]